MELLTKLIIRLRYILFMLYFGLSIRRLGWFGIDFRNDRYDLEQSIGLSVFPNSLAIQ